MADECGVCGKPLDSLTADGNLLACWMYCDECQDDLFREMRLGQAWDHHIRRYVRWRWRLATRGNQGVADGA